MERPKAVLRTIGGEPVLRFERRIAHPPEKVWRAVSDPAELAHWFPAEVRTEPRAGAPVRFAFPGEDPNGGGAGKVLEYDPPRVHAFTWEQDVLRFELFPDGEGGCLLVFTHTVGGGAPGLLTAGRAAYGWDTCLAALEDRLAGAEPAPPGGMLEGVEGYVARFGLDQGEVRPGGDGGGTVHFARDLGWAPVEKAWEILSGGGSAEPGGEPPAGFTNAYVPPGRISAAEPPHLLEYAWLHEGEPAGAVRWELVHAPETGTRVELAQTVPARLSEALPTALAAWQTQLEILFAAVHGEVRRPWPEERTAELERMYAERLG
ncbi:SRPBCC family protein [Nocardiopsis potens]|uniref:SRPBCC family protein n=1 Tax=Nocardiopsis potens TaxID=1246458 RepID=UPI00034CA9C5|nr:SRPBCC family protein [Nocardiopsis potens]